MLSTKLMLAAGAGLARAVTDVHKLTHFRPACSVEIVGAYVAR